MYLHDYSSRPAVMQAANRHCRRVAGLAWQDATPGAG